PWTPPPSTVSRTSTTPRSGPTCTTAGRTRGRARPGGPPPGPPSPPSGARLEDEVERGLRGPAEPGEARVQHHLTDRGLAGLCPQGVPAALRQRVGHAEEGREVVVDPADRVQVVRDRVAGAGLD